MFAQQENKRDRQATVSYVEAHISEAINRYSGIQHLGPNEKSSPVDSPFTSTLFQKRTLGVARLKFVNFVGHDWLCSCSFSQTYSI